MAAIDYKASVMKFLYIVIIVASFFFENTNLLAQNVPLIIAPVSDSGKAVIKPYYNFERRCFFDSGAKCYVSYDETAIIFDFIVPKDPDYTLVGQKQRDASLWHDDSVEVVLRAPQQSDYYHYIVNCDGFVYDAENKNSQWDGTAKINVKKDRDFWQARIAIPFSDFGFAIRDDSEVYMNIVVSSFGPGNRYVNFWAPAKDSIHDASTFGKLILSANKPYVEELDIERQMNNNSGKAVSKFKFENPSDQDFSLYQGSNCYTIKPKSSLTIEDVQDVNYAGNVWEVQPFFLYSCNFEKKPEPVKYYAKDIDTLKVTWIDGNSLIEKADRVEVAIDENILLSTTPSMLGKEEINISTLEEGWHFAQFIMIKNNKIVQNIVRKIYTVRPSVIDYNLSEADFTQYYNPINIVNDFYIKSALSEFDFSDGPFPKQILVQDNGLFEKPIEIYFDDNVAKFSSTRLEKVSNNQVSISAKGEVGEYNIVVEANLYYDGFIWYDLKIDGSYLKYDSLKVVIPCSISGDVLYNHGTLYPDSLFSKQKVADIKAPTALKLAGYDGRFQAKCGLLEEPQMTIPLTYHVAIASDKDEKYKGISVLSEGPKGWNLSDYDNVYNIVKDNDKCTLTINISDGKKNYETDLIEFSFGIQPFPLRKYTQDHNLEYRMNDCALFESYWKFTNLNENNEPITQAEYFANKGITIANLFQEWIEHQNYWKTSTQEEWIKFSSKSLHAEGVKVIPYFGFEIANTIPEFELYHDMVFVKPTTFPDGAYRRRGWAEKYVDPEMRAWPVSYRGFWGDRQINGMFEAMDKYDFDGFYMDGTLLPFANGDIESGYGIIDPYGRLIVSWDVLNKRSFQEKLFTLGQRRKGRELVLDLHVNAPMPATSSLVTSTLTGEASHLFDPKGRLNEGMLRAQLNGKLYGIPSEQYLRPPYNAKRGFAQSLLVDSYVRLNAGGPAIWTQSCYKIWDIFDKYQLSSEYFVPFFSSYNLVKSDNSKIKVSYYKREDCLVMIVSNYWEDQPQVVTLDLSGFQKLDFNSIKDIWNSATIETEGSNCKLTVPSEDMCILYLRCMN